MVASKVEREIAARRKRNARRNKMGLAIAVATLGTTAAGVEPTWAFPIATGVGIAEYGLLRSAEIDAVEEVNLLTNPNAQIPPTLKTTVRRKIHAAMRAIDFISANH